MKNAETSDSKKGEGGKRENFNITDLSPSEF